MGRTQSREIQLLFLDLVDQFNTSEGDGCVSETLKAKNWSHSWFDLTMVLFDGVITNDKFCLSRW